MIAAVCAVWSLGAVREATPATTLHKVEDRVVYLDPMYYCAFPSVVVRGDGELLCAFRRAPSRRALWGAAQDSHTDPNSQLVLVRSGDGGQTWSREPELIFAHPLGGSQDPCLAALRDGGLVCTSYGWAQLPPERVKATTETLQHPPFAFLGGYVLRSDDDARTWHGPLIPAPVPGDVSRDALGKPTPAYNRGAMLERADGTLLWAVVRCDSLRPRRSSVHIVRSRDRGETWMYGGVVAADARVSFNETSLVETARGEVVAFLRTEGLRGRAAAARSIDGGATFAPWQDLGFVGHPFHALRLPDQRIILVYGYRQAPFGVRARLLGPDGADTSTAAEVVIRDDGGNGDVGYPWAALLPDGRIFVVYYFNKADGTRHIAASVLELR